ncbi:recombinase family protein [Streptomyces sioyaensis]|uniref:recombinase family protein n=1 Tax=Streptomyces sioyaensis TaxID=67364 RepID=UPI0037D32B97
MDVTGTLRRVPVALYIATADQDAAELLTDYCRQYAAARDWQPVQTVTDTDRQAPLMERTGWVRLLALLSHGSIRGVVTYSPAMVAAPQGEYEAVRTLMRDRGAFLVTARTTTNAPPSRTPAQTARRHSLADAAAGYEGCGADGGSLR